MAKVESITVASGEDGQRLDRWFKTHYPQLKFGQLQKLLRTGQIRVDGKRAKGDHRLEAGAEIRIPPFPGTSNEPARPAKPKKVAAEDVSMLHDRVLYRDKDVLVIDKPAGLAVQGGSKTTRHLDAMMDALTFEADEPPRLVHRLDKDTSGVLVLARHQKAARALSKAFKSRASRKIYWALVIGVPKPPVGEISSHLEKRGGAGGEKVEISDRGQHALTYYEVIDQAAQKIAWLGLMPATGRTHQLRVHCAGLGTPIVGDGKYGGAEAFPDGLANQLHLHARSIRLPHPSGGMLEAEAPLPAHMKQSFERFGFNPNEAGEVFADVD